MNRKRWLMAALMVIPLAIGAAMAYFNSSGDGAYICPITGEKLPCPKCCPLNHSH